MPLIRVLQTRRVTSLLATAISLFALLSIRTLLLQSSSILDLHRRDESSINYKLPLASIAITSASLELKLAAPSSSKFFDSLANVAKALENGGVKVVKDATKNDSGASTTSLGQVGLGLVSTSMDGGGGTTPIAPSIAGLQDFIDAGASLATQAFSGAQSLSNIGIVNTNLFVPVTPPSETSILDQTSTYQHSGLRSSSIHTNQAMDTLISSSTPPSTSSPVTQCHSVSSCLGKAVLTFPKTQHVTHHVEMTVICSVLSILTITQRENILHSPSSSSSTDAISNALCIKSTATSIRNAALSRASSVDSTPLATSLVFRAPPNSWILQRNSVEWEEVQSIFSTAFAKIDSMSRDSVEIVLAEVELALSHALFDNEKIPRITITEVSSKTKLP